MKKINLYYKFEKPDFDKSLALRSAAGALLGASLKGVIKILSSAAFCPWSIGGWALAGAVVAIASKFFIKLHNHNNELRATPPILQEDVVEKKTLHQRFIEKWGRIAGNDAKLMADLTQHLIPIAKDNDISSATYLSIWDPKAFSVAVIDFAQSKNIVCQTPKAVWEYAEQNITDFVDYLVAIKCKRRTLAAFEESAQRFLEDHVPIRMPYGTFIRGKPGKTAFEEQVKTFISFVSRVLV
jgi:hypothetical protein